MGNDAIENTKGLSPHGTSAKALFALALLTFGQLIAEPAFAG